MIEQNSNLPNCERAFVQDAKLTSYLLNSAHPQNGGKARFYELIGFTIANVSDLQEVLIGLACTGTVINQQPNVEGTKYVVVGLITAPNGKQYELKTIWVCEPPENSPRLVTAYPN